MGEYIDELRELIQRKIDDGANPLLIKMKVAGYITITLIVLAIFSALAIFIFLAMPRFILSILLIYGIGYLITHLIMKKGGS